MAQLISCHAYARCCEFVAIFDVPRRSSSPTPCCSSSATQASRSCRRAGSSLRSASIQLHICIARSVVANCRSCCYNCMEWTQTSVCWQGRMRCPWTTISMWSIKQRPHYATSSDTTAASHVLVDPYVWVLVFNYAWFVWNYRCFSHKWAELKTTCS